MLLALLGSLAILIGGIVSIAAAGWMTEKGLSVFGMVAVAAVGLTFIHLQMTATALTLSLAVECETPTDVPTSNPQNSSGDQT
jgi:succinate-acetate transporter protein